MQKKIIIITVSVLIMMGVFIFVCYLNFQGQQRNYNPDVSIDPSKKYLIEIWDLKNPNMYISETMQQNFWDENIKSFNDKYPNVHVDVKLLNEEEYFKKLDRGKKTNTMADIVIDWHGTPFIYTDYQIPVDIYFEMGAETFLAGPLNYVMYNDSQLGYPLLAKPEVLICNYDILTEFIDIPTIVSSGWTFKEFQETLIKIKEAEKTPMYILDHKGIFTASLLVQGDVNSVIANEQLNWYGQTMVDMYNSIDSYREDKLLNYSDKWLVDFFRGEVVILGGVDTWVVDEVEKRNYKLKEKMIKNPGSNTELTTVLLPYPHKRDYNRNYAMTVVSAITFSQGNYKGDDHTKVVMEFVHHFSDCFSIEFSKYPGYIPTKEENIKKWSGYNGLDEYSSQSLRVSTQNGKPVKSRYYDDREIEEIGIQEVEAILDEYWRGKISLKEMYNEFNPVKN